MTPEMVALVERIAAEHEEHAAAWELRAKAHGEDFGASIGWHRERAEGLRSLLRKVALRLVGHA